MLHCTSSIPSPILLSMNKPFSQRNICEFVRQPEWVFVRLDLLSLAFKEDADMKVSENRSDKEYG